MTRAWIFLVGLCACTSIEPVMVPENVRFTAKVELDPQGRLVNSTGILPTHAVVGLDGDAATTTWLLGYDEEVLRGDETTEELDDAQFRLQAACSPRFPNPVWALRKRGADHDETSVPPALSIDWMRCPSLAGATEARSVWALCEGEPCPLTLTQEGCSLQLDFQGCGPGRVRGSIGFDGDVCLQRDEEACQVIQGADGAQLQVACGESPSCDVILARSGELECSRGACRLASCGPASADCDGDPRNGCEVDILTDSSHCGACGSACDHCRFGVCQTGSPDLAVSDNNTCVVSTGGELFCSGRNDHGQLARDPTPFEPQLVAIEGINDVTQVSVGLTHVCALGRGGHVYCWGNALDRQLGHEGSLEQSLVPEVSNPILAAQHRALTTYADGTCAIHESGSVRCWGRFPGALDGRVQALIGLPPIRQLSMTLSFACATTFSGNVYCWGEWGGAMDLGLPATRLPSPARVPQVERAKEVSVSGNEVCILLDDGVTDCVGALGRYTVGDVAHIAPGLTATCMTHREGRVSCAGRNVFGLFQDPDRAMQPATLLPHSEDVQNLVISAVHACASTGTRQVACWGLGDAGQLANGVDSIKAPALHPHLADVEEIAMGRHHLCVRKATGIVDCSGATLGTGAGVRATQHRIGDGFSSLASAEHYSCALKQGTVHCWGTALAGGMGPGAGQGPPLPVSGLSNIEEVALYDEHTCVRDSTNQVFCMGKGSFGQLGNGRRDNSDIPTQVPDLEAIALGVGGDHSCAITSDRHVKCWGLGARLQSGGPTTETPRVVPALDAASKLALGASHSCVLRSNGEAVCFGNGADGQLGHGAQSPSAAPTRFPVNDVVDVAAGDDFTCVLDANGAVFCAGANGFGQLGDGTIERRSTPIQVTLPSGERATSIAAQNGWACARLASGRVSCWGQNGGGIDLEVQSLAPRRIDVP